MKLQAISENHLYRKAYAGGRRSTRDTVSVYVLRDKHAARLRRENPMGTTVNRVGIAASKKIGGAVERNRAKRVIREAYRQTDAQIGIKKGYLVVIAARRAATVRKMQDVKRDLQSCLTSLNMLDDAACTTTVGGKKSTVSDAAENAAERGGEKQPPFAPNGQLSGAER